MSLVFVQIRVNPFNPSHPCSNPTSFNTIIQPFQITLRKMKKTLLIPVMFAYLLAYTGILVNFHYCMGHLRSTDMGWSTNSTASKCGMQMKKSSCCQDKSQFFKADDNHKAITTDYHLDAPIALIQPVSFVVPTAFVSTIGLIVPKANAPPPQQISLHIFHCVFRC